MNKNILNTGVQEFIIKNKNTDIMSVLLKKPIFDDVSNNELVEQLEARKKSEKKLPTWFSASNIYYPNKLNIEQTSSEITAKYKADLVSGKSLVDVTGGLGVDSYFFSKKTERVYHCELNENLSEIATYNLRILDAENVQTYNEDGLYFIKKSNTNFDWIYVDPSRRNDLKQRIFLLSDCLPNVVDNLDLMLSKSDNILIKTAPLLDISAGIKELDHIKEIHIVAIQNDVKELLWVLQKKYQGSISIKTINKTLKGDQTFNFNIQSEKEAISKFSEPLIYLYEPNAAILKSGAFKIIGQAKQVKKLHTNTHLYTSNSLIDFPGRRFIIEVILPYNKSALKKARIKKANITTRNFPESVVTIRKKMKIKDGGEIYLFFTKDLNENVVVLQCKRV
ncbi:class I SAM-dependent methyltransferase [Zobellia uliginosa]|uniref:class I SAM-dependent methyltransferase n=1 Tax=Zobellia uliginosa TaxID=143224 RepID=UPI001C06AA15|nr:class I SAM-dependent methyltransferase [Zobellia uliginosa]MBU2945623.1 class I SAM-dependent methyltransferase [Zobellia uliginosa]